MTLKKTTALLFLIANIHLFAATNEISSQKRQTVVTMDARALLFNKSIVEGGLGAKAGLPLSDEQQDHLTLGAVGAIGFSHLHFSGSVGYSHEFKLLEQAVFVTEVGGRFHRMVVNAKGINFAGGYFDPSIDFIFSDSVRLNLGLDLELFTAAPTVRWSGWIASPHVGIKTNF